MKDRAPAGDLRMLTLGRSRLAGVGKMPYGRFLTYNVLGGGCWAVVMGGLGYTLGRNLPLLERSVRWLGLGGAGVLILAVASVLYRRRHRNKVAAVLSPRSSKKERSR